MAWRWNYGDAKHSQVLANLYLVCCDIRRKTGIADNRRAQSDEKNQLRTNGDRVSFGMHEAASWQWKSVKYETVANIYRSLQPVAAPNPPLRGLLALQ